jgi:hypothetical protein
MTGTSSWPLWRIHVRRQHLFRELLLKSRSSNGDRWGLAHVSSPPLHQSLAWYHPDNRPWAVAVASDQRPRDGAGDARRRWAPITGLSHAMSPTIQSESIVYYCALQFICTCEHTTNAVYQIVWPVRPHEYTPWFCVDANTSAPKNAKGNV